MQILKTDSFIVMNDAAVAAAVLSAEDQGKKNYKQYSADRLASCVVPITDNQEKQSASFRIDTEKGKIEISKHHILIKK